MSPDPAMPTTSAVILAAGRGTRLSSHGAEAFSKPLFRVGACTLLEHAMARCVSAGVTDIFVVTGFAADQVRECLRRWRGARVVEIHNPDWGQPNGLSLSVCRKAVRGDFLLLMADHLFDSTILRDLGSLPQRGGVTLAIDRRLDSIFDMDDATKVLVDQERITAIGKQITSYNAVDCGLFRCSPDVFSALDAAQARGELSLSHAMQELSRRGAFHAMDIGDRWWQDVDTPEMAQEAERLLQKNDSGDC